MTICGDQMNVFTKPREAQLNQMEKYHRIGKAWLFHRHPLWDLINQSGQIWDPIVVNVCHREENDRPVMRAKNGKDLTEGVCQI